ncbi:hypothetical protein F5884DRAFT_258907 [Xylogone sp. PMI_703]|nr:hypothetical protein F5884DRAFT_258907 [Xylogone sp. PMI_703]
MRMETVQVTCTCTTPEITSPTLHLRYVSIYDLDKFKSGSKITHDQYLLKRVLYRSNRYQDLNLHRFGRARKFARVAHVVHDDPEWQQYLNHHGQARCEGVFALVGLFQRASAGLFARAAQEQSEEPEVTWTRSGRARRPAAAELPGGAEQAMEEEEEDDADDEPKDDVDELEVRDEQVATCALVTFLNAATTGLVLRHWWTPERKGFQVPFGEDAKGEPAVFEARSDGFLQDVVTG